MQAELWGLTTLFNPRRARSRIQNYREFRRRSREQGLPLLTVELAFGDAEFELVPGEDAEILLQLRSASVLWQKERLLNIGLSKLPLACKKVAWADADILFDDKNWVRRTSTLLDRYVVVQPYSDCIRLPRGADASEFPKRQLLKSIPLGDGEGTFSRSVCYRMAKKSNPTFSGATGYAWSAQRAFLDQVGFYDRCIIGGADREMALAFHFPPGKVPKERRRITHPRLLEHLGSWHAKVHSLVDGKVHFRPGLIHHLWHGAAEKRNYSDRHAILSEHDFDPERDIQPDSQGCWEFCTEKTQLAAAIGEYFSSRSEDG